MQSPIQVLQLHWLMMLSKSRLVDTAQSFCWLIARHFRRGAAKLDSFVHKDRRIGKSWQCQEKIGRLWRFRQLTAMVWIVKDLLQIAHCTLADGESYEGKAYVIGPRLALTARECVDVKVLVPVPASMLAGVTIMLTTN